MKKKKILMVANTSDMFNKFLVSHIEDLIKDDNEIDIAYGLNHEIDAYLYKNCQNYLLSFDRSPLSKNNIGAYKELRKIIISENYDFIHTHTPIPSALVRLIKKHNKIKAKLIYTVHGFHFFKGGPIKNWILYYPIERYLSKYTDCLVTINEEDYSLAKNKFNAGRTEYIRGIGFDYERFNTIGNKEKVREKYNYRNDEFIMFYAAELNDNKNQILLLKAMDCLVNEKGIKDIKLVLAGDGENKKAYEDYIIKKNLSLNVDLLGFVDKVDELLFLSDITVASSKREGLPVNILESMAAGRPVIATNVRGHRNLIVDYETGLLISNLDDLVDRIIELRESEELYDKLSGRARPYSQEYRIDKILSDMKIIYKKLV